MKELKAVPTMLTIKETVQKTGLSEYFLRALVSQKKIVFVYTGRKFLINYEKLIDYLNRGDASQSPELMPLPADYGKIRRVDL